MSPTYKEAAEAVMCYFMTVTVKNGILPHNNVIYINLGHNQHILYYNMKTHITCGLTYPDINQ